MENNNQLIKGEMPSNLYMICYDLNAPNQNYNLLYDAIRSYGAWWHHLDSLWIIKTQSTATEIRDNLRQFIDSNDSLLVTHFGSSWASAGMPKKATEWLRKNAYQ